VKFAIDHAIDGVDCAGYEAVYFDEAFWAALGRSLRLGRELLRLDRTDLRIVRHVRCEPNRDPDSPAGQALGDSKASFVEELDYDRTARRGAWRTIPNIFADRVRTQGTIEIVEAPHGVRRIVRGEVDARMFGFGRIVEKHVIAEIEQSYAKAAAFTTAWLAQRRA
jgi:hypothetical protein